MRNKVVFKTVDNNDREIELCVVRPSPKQNVEAQLVFNREWRKAEESGSMLRSQLDDVNDKRSLWGPEQRQRVEAINSEVLDLERKLRGGAANLSSVAEGKELALKIRTLRNERLNLLRGRMQLDNYTAESFAEAARLQYLVSACVFDAETGKNAYFKSYDDFISRSEEKTALDSFTNYMQLTIDMEPQDNYEDTWLKKYKFVNEKGYIINTDGKMIDPEGRLINEDYQWVKEDGVTLCDKNGNPVDKDGNYTIEYREFE